MPGKEMYLYDDNIDEVTPIPADTKKLEKPPTENDSMATTCASSNGPDMLLDDDQEKYSTQPYLRSFGRPEARREPPRILGWTFARWLLLLSNILLLLYGLFFVLGSIITYAKGYQRAIVVMVANSNLVAVTFVASLLAVMTSIVGLVGVRRKDRRILGVYCLMLWPCFAFLSAVGYLSYKGDVWNLRDKLGMQWRYEFSPDDRIALQDNLHCCGFDNPQDHAAYFARCWPESLLPGCDYKLYLFEHQLLVNTYTVTFSLVPVHILIIIISLLCSNHVDHLFGSRPRPAIAYLGPFHDWRDWEQSRLQEEKTSLPEATVTRARTTGTDHFITPRHSHEKN